MSIVQFQVRMSDELVDRLGEAHLRDWGATSLSAFYRLIIDRSTVDPSPPAIIGEGGPANVKVNFRFHPDQWERLEHQRAAWDLPMSKTIKAMLSGYLHHGAADLLRHGIEMAGRE